MPNAFYECDPDAIDYPDLGASRIMKDPNRTSLNRLRSMRGALTLKVPQISPWFRIFGLSLMACAAVLAVVAAITIYEVTTNFQELRSEASDNVEWSLAQAELETRDFTNALEVAMLKPEDDLSQLRLRYDIFYSRVTTLLRSPNYQRLNTSPEFDAALKRVSAFVETSVTIIDLPDEQLRQALPVLAEKAGNLRNDTRTLSLKGLTFFAEASDSRRQQINSTLLRLTTSIFALILTLVTLLIHLFSNYRRTRQHSQTISQANVRMNTILTASLDGIIVVDDTGHILEFNQACEQLFGYQFEDIEGLPYAELIVPLKYRQEHNERIKEILAHTPSDIAAIGRIRMEAHRSDGTTFPVEVSIEKAEENNRSIFIGFIHDISDRVAAERELVQTRDSALAGERAKAEFLTVMSHEIRTPLNGILGNLSLLNDTPLSRSQNRYIRNMEISGRVLMRHVDAVLNIARHEAGVLDVSIGNVDLSVLLQDLIDSQLSAATAKATSLSWRWEGVARNWVRTDRAALEQILLNFIGNAIKFTEQGSIIVEAEQVPATSGEQPAIELRVIDTGAGIAEDHLGHVFDDFITNDSTFGGVPGGTGLGLGIAKRFTDNLGGEIGVNSTQSKGSVFWVRLPMEDGQRIDAHDDTTQEEAPKQLRLLLAEDNKINRELAKEFLVHEGNSVSTANNGEECVRMAESLPFDLILMDISMPVMDGLQATRAIREGQGANRETPIIAVSANVLPAERKRLIAAGMDGFLAKPLNRNALQHRLQRAHRRGRTTKGNGPAALPNTGTSKLNAPLLDAATLESNKTTLPEETYHRLLSRFINEGNALSHAITAPYRHSKKVARSCHDLAGSSAIFGARAFHLCLVEADTAFKEKDLATFEKKLVELPVLWRRTCEALSAELPSDAAE